MLSGFVLIIIVVIYSGCDKKIGKLPVADPTAVNCDTIKYSRHIKPIVAASCAKGGCHDANTKQSGFDFNVYSTLKAQADLGRIKARVIDGPSFMPADKGKLPDPQYKMIKCWLEKGAPND